MKTVGYKTLSSRYSASTWTPDVERRQPLGQWVWFFSQSGVGGLDAQRSRLLILVKNDRNQIVFNILENFLCLTSVWCHYQSLKSAFTIQIWFDLTRIRKRFICVSPLCHPTLEVYSLGPVPINDTQTSTPLRRGQIYKKDAHCTETNIKYIFRFFYFLSYGRLFLQFTLCHHNFIKCAG